MDVAYRTYVHYFHQLTRDQAVSALQDAEVGTFLVRKSSRPGCLVISLKQTAKVLHLLVLKRGNGYGVDPDAWKQHSIGTESFSSLELLIHRLKQLRLLSHGLTMEEIDNVVSGSATLGQRGKAELKQALEGKDAAAAQAASNLEHEYKGMIAVILRDQQISTRQLASIAQWRQRNNFTIEQHEKVLKALGTDSDAFDSLPRVNESSAEEQLCVVCLDAPKAAVFVACGHMATCYACSQSISQCPMCRAPKTQVIKVFK